MLRRFLRSVGLAVLYALALSLPAMAQQGVGAIGGTVADDSGGVLPGATVTLSNPGMIGGNQETVTNERGAYQFIRLVPGSYSVAAELSGFRRAVQQNVAVNANATARVDLKLATGVIEESVTVTGQAPLLDTTSAVHQTVMTRDVLDALPTGADIWSIARTTPAVTISKIDVGGKEMIAQSVAYVHGSTNTENSYLMDGMEINHYSTGTGQAVNYYVDTFQAAEFNYQAGQSSAEQAVGGVIINLITKTGTNTVHGAAMYSGTGQSLQANNLTTALRQQLLAGVPAAALNANPSIVPGGEIALLFDSAFTVSGPIVKDRLWYFGHVKLGKSNQYKVGSYNADGTQLLSDNTLADGLGKVSWAVSKNNQLHYFFTAAGKLMGLDEDRLANAVTIALTPHVALNKGVGAMSMWKGVRSAEATKCGVWAAILAREGMTGPPQPFEGRGGLWYSQNRMGREFTLPEQVRLQIERVVNKRFPSDQMSQQTLSLIPEMRAWTKHDEIASIQYYMPFGDWEEVGDAPKWDPRNRDTADHSIPYVLSRNLISGDSYLDAFALEKLPFRDPVVRALMDKITLYPVNEWRGNGTARIIIRKNNGEERFWDTHGGSRDPGDMSEFKQMSDEDITNKFIRVCAYRHVADRQRDQALAQWWNLRAIKDIGEPMRTLATFGRPEPL